MVFRCFQIGFKGANVGIRSGKALKNHPYYPNETMVQTLDAQAEEHNVFRVWTIVEQQFEQLSLNNITSTGGNLYSAWATENVVPFLATNRLSTLRWTKSGLSESSFELLKITCKCQIVQKSHANFILRLPWNWRLYVLRIAVRSPNFPVIAKIERRSRRVTAVSRPIYKISGRRWERVKTRSSDLCSQVVLLGQLP